MCCVKKKKKKVEFPLVKWSYYMRDGVTTGVAELLQQRYYKCSGVQLCITEFSYARWSFHRCSGVTTAEFPVTVEFLPVTVT